MTKQDKRPVGYPAFDEGYRDYSTVPLRANYHRAGTWCAKLWSDGWMAAAFDSTALLTLVSAPSTARVALAA